MFTTSLNNGGHGALVESYQNGADWYRVYSDGWCEQGGWGVGLGQTGQAVNLLKPYPDSPLVYFSVFAEIIDYTSGSQKVVSCRIQNTTGNKFYVYTSTTNGWGNYNFNWQARGYL